VEAAMACAVVATAEPVTRKLYPGMGHIVSGDEIENVQRVMDEVLA
jgi:hypothetical protein